jgi:succinyl-diaminopimelate desuccinylase
MNKHLATLMRKSDIASRLQTTTLSQRFLVGNQVTLESLLAKVVSYKTISYDKATNRKAMSYVDRFLRKRGMKTRYVEHNGHPSLYAHTRDVNFIQPTVLLAGHMDVVYAHDRDFRMQVTDKHYVGRGVLDMKFAIASYMKLVDDLKSNLKAYDFGILITSDEEITGRDGIPHFIQEGLKPKVCILPDGGFDWQIQTLSNGFLFLALTARGKNAHGSLPWLGDNAILKLTAALHEITNTFSNTPEDTDTINIGIIEGGNAANQVPDYARATVDIRYHSEERKQQIFKNIERATASRNIEVEVIENGLAAPFSLDNPMIRPFAELITTETGVAVEGMKTRASNDTRFFAGINVPCISLYIPGGKHHAEGEWIDRKSFEQFHTILGKYIESQARQP